MSSQKYLRVLGSQLLESSGLDIESHSGDPLGAHPALAVSPVCLAQAHNPQDRTGIHSTSRPANWTQTLLMAAAGGKPPNLGSSALYQASLRLSWRAPRSRRQGVRASQDTWGRSASPGSRCPSGCPGCPSSPGPGPGLLLAPELTPATGDDRAPLPGAKSGIWPLCILALPLELRRLLGRPLPFLT